MNLLPCGRSGLLLELDALDEVLGTYAALQRQLDAGELDGVVELVPAARTVLVRIDPELASVASVARAVRSVRPDDGVRGAGELVELPVVYDGADLGAVAELTGWSVDDVVRRHTGVEWTVAFCGFAPGFGYLVPAGGGWSVPRRTTPRTRVPAGAVALAGEFSGVYPRVSPGGWQLIGRTDVTVFDLDRDPPALLTPGARVRFVAVGSGAA